MLQTIGIGELIIRIKPTITDTDQLRQPGTVKSNDRFNNIEAHFGHDIPDCSMDDAKRLFAEFCLRVYKARP